MKLKAETKLIDYQEEIESILKKNNWNKALTMYNWVVENAEIDAFFNAANIFALYMNYNDHGRSHAIIAGRNAILVYDLLKDVVPPSIVQEGFGDYDDAALIILISAMLHDIGMAVHRTVHYHHSTTIAFNLLRPKLLELYGDVKKSTLILSHILHGIYAHDEAIECLTIEAGVVTIADGLDMAQGRSRGPYKRNKTDIHSISASAISEVHIKQGTKKPVRVEVHMKNHAGVFQLEEILAKKMSKTKVRKYVEIVTFVNDEELSLPRLKF